MKLWLDKKIDLMLEVLRKGAEADDLPAIIKDIRDCDDAARRYPIRDRELYRVRCNKLLICVGIIKRVVVGKDWDDLDVLEASFIGVLSGRVKA